MGCAGAGRSANRAGSLRRAPARGAGLAQALSLALLAACAPPIPEEAAGPSERVEFEFGRVGGLCASPDGGGAPCELRIVVRDDGTWEGTPGSGTVTPGAATELATIVDDRWRAFTATAFTGTCPVAYDGQEFYFLVRRLPAGEGAAQADAEVREVRSCLYDLEHSDAVAALAMITEVWSVLGLPGTFPDG